MKTDYISCESCGSVLDLLMIKEISKQPWAIHGDGDNAKCRYGITGDFEYIRCPTCGCTMQRKLKMKYKTEDERLDNGLCPKCEGNLIKYQGNNKCEECNHIECGWC